MRSIVLLLLSPIAALLLGSCTTAPSVVESRAAASPVEQFVDGVRRTVLPNGLTVLTREHRGSGVVAITTWVKAGYFHEPDEVAGMAHLFEHMFFKGSKAYPGPEAISQAISAAGGSTNAGTIYDSTNYYVVLPRENLAQGVAVQADAIANPLFDPEELRKEAEVVIEESNRKYDNASAVSFERMLATSFTRHRIKRWRIGSNEVLRNIRRENLMAFFETLYRPENIVVTVAGDVSHEEALDAVQRSFGGIPRGQLRKERGPTEPPQQAFRFGRSEADIKEGYSSMGWHTVPENHPDEVALEVLADILGGGRSSRFYRAAVGPRGASTVNASHYTFEDVGILSAQATMPEANRAEVERRLVAEIERMKRYGPTAYELAQAKNSREAAFLRGIDTSLGQAQALSSAEARGSYRDIAKQRAELLALTADRVREVANRYLTLEKLTLYHYQPKGAPAVAEAAALQRLREAATVAAKEPEALPLPDVRNTVRAADADSPLRSFTLSNGATLMVQQRAGTPVVATRLYFRGGRIQETAANAGITRLMQAAMRRGSAQRSGEAIDREIDFLGGRLALATSEDGFGFAVDSTAATYEPVLAIVADMILAPTFPEEGVARERAIQVAGVRRTLDSATERPLQLFRSALYGDHPYGLPELGTEASLARLDRASLQQWWKSTIAADRMMIVVVGNAAAEDVRRVVEAKLAALPRSAAPLAVPPPPARPAGTREAVEQRERKQTAMVIGFPAVPQSHPDYAALRMLQAVTSGLSGTFFAELRSRQSLAYTVSARPASFAERGVFYGYLACEASKEDVARRALLAEIRKLQGEGVKGDDLERAKAYFSGSTRLQREGTGSLASDYGRNFLLRLPMDSTDQLLRASSALSVADLQAAARKYLAGEDYIYAAVRGK